MGVTMGDVEGGERERVGGVYVSRVDEEEEDPC